MIIRDGLSIAEEGISKDAGPYIVDLQKGATAEEIVNLHERYNKDVIAAVEWIKQQPYTDFDHIAMTGISYGGIQTILTAEKDPVSALTFRSRPPPNRGPATALCK